MYVWRLHIDLNLLSYSWSLEYVLLVVEIPSVGGMFEHANGGFIAVENDQRRLGLAYMEVPVGIW